MLKSDALRLLGGTNSTVADACGISAQAVSQWPDVLTKDIEDRVLAALARKHLPPGLISGEQTGEHAAAEGVPLHSQAEADAVIRSVKAAFTDKPSNRREER